MLTRSIAVLLCASVAPLPWIMQGKGKAPALKGTTETFDDVKLSITFPEALGTITPQQLDPKGKQIRGVWDCKLGESSLSIRLQVMPVDSFGFEEPEDVTDVTLEHLRKTADATFAYTSEELVDGPYGWASFGALSRGPVHDAAGEEESMFYCFGGLLETAGYSIEVRAEPKLDAKGDALVLDMLRRGVAYSGKQRNSQWTDEEAKKRWLEVAPESIAKKFDKPLRTKHYVVLTNHNGPGNFLKKLEENYETIRKTYPFLDTGGRRLMPVYLFLTEDQYNEFFAKHFKTTIEEADKSAGVSSRDFYATYYNDPGDPTHIHECTHQIFANRLHLGGGGSWFQEGVAEYMSTKDNDRADAARDVKKNKHTKLADFIAIKSLLFSPKKDVKGENEASTHYELASLLIEFVRESKTHKDKFLDWIHAVGRVPRNNAIAIERATKATLGVDLATLEAQWIEYCKKR